jgi:UDP-N-acetylmuramyl tripeptide synthase
MSDLPLRSQLAVALGRTASRMSRLAGRGDGSVIGGKIGLKLDPELLTRLSADRKLVLVSATNGKTTTTRLIASAMSGLGEVATNAFGANMPTGHVSALAAAPNARYGVLECDEKYVPLVLKETGANVVLLMNLSRDQMDRAGEIWQLAGKWRRALEGTDTHVAPTATTRWSPGAPPPPSRSPGWRSASTGKRTPGAAPSAAARSTARPATGPAASAPSPAPSPTGSCTATG